MSRVQIYQGSFVNTETTRPDNLNIQQLCVLKIYNNEFRGITAPHTAAAIFYETPQKVRVPATDWFYVGQIFFVAGVSSNVGPFTVNNVVPVGSDIDVYVNEVTAGFFEPSATFTDDDPGQPEPAVIELEMTDTPAVISVIDNEEDAFTPVRSKQLEIGIYSGNGIDISSFADGGDQKWYVEYLVNSVMKFIGFLSISEISQPFMPDPNVINLVATDGLGFLSDIPLTDFDEVNPQTENTIMDYIAWALHKTGLELNIVVCMNVRERLATPLISDDTGDGHFYKWMYLDAKTFEDEIGVSEDCRTVLEKILSEMCSLYQDNGTWFIMRKDEYAFDRLYYLFKFDFEGTFIEATQEQFEKNIGTDLPLSWMEDAQVLLERPYKSLKLIYKYEVPKEVICNIDYARGDESSDVDVQRAGYTSYSFDCWTAHRLWGADLDTASFEFAILRAFNALDDETERFIMLTMPATETGAFEYIRSSPIPLGFMDRFTFSFEASAMQDPNGDGVLLVCMILLYGTDGSVWVLRASDTAIVWTNDMADADTVWRSTDSEVTLFRSGLWWSVYDDADHPVKTEWANFSMNAAPVPVDGNVYIHLFSANQFAGTFDDFDIRYQNLQFEYRHYIGGSYRRYTGQQHKAEQFINTVALREKEVFISDSPKIMFKGALLKVDEPPNYELANEFYDGSLFPNADFTDDDIRPFGELQLFDVWNQINRLMRRFDGVIDGLESDGDMPDLKYKYFITDASENTDNKMFMLLHFEQEQHLCEQTSFLTEVADSTIEKVYTGNSFKYLTSGE